MILTASLSSGVARVAYGADSSVLLIDEILRMSHRDWETTLFVGDTEYRQTKEGPIPNHQLRISVNPSAGFAALNYMDHEDPGAPISNSYNPRRPLPDIDLIFNGDTGAVFPRSAIIPIPDARAALIEWSRTRRRPRCIEWRPYDSY